ncbi:MAG: hypothetical protein H6739_32065 [Alphaproteobacteria bacterium]|nr:hypothetical protein [Alphaproteobacteria bacterium]
MFLFHEIHCDDALLERRRDRPTWAAARALVGLLVDAAEAAGSRLALRFRYPFAEATAAFEGPESCIARWQARGHEIGAHAHRRQLRRAVNGLRAAGATGLRAAVPGLIRSTRRTCLRTLGPARALGLDVITDQPQFGAFAYSGLTPWRPAPDLRGPGDGPFVFVDVSVNPFAWGLLRREADRVTHTLRLGPAEFGRLEALLDAQLAEPRPHPVCHFGAALHEHNLARGWEDLRPHAPSLQAWADHLARAAARPVISALPIEIADRWRAAEPRPIGPSTPRPSERLLHTIDRKDLRFDGPSWIAERLGPDLSRLRGPLAPLRRARARVAFERRRWPARVRSRGARRQRLQVGDRTVEVVRFGPARPRLAIVLSHAGRFGGTTLGLRPFGLTPADLPDAAIWAWDRTGTGATRGASPLAPGQPAHVEEAAAVFALAAAEGAPTGWMCFSGGLIQALLCLDRCDPAFFIDAEGPADRRSLAPNPEAGLLADPLGAELAHLDKLDDPAWAWREPWRLVGALRCPYHRLQAEIDHAHGRCSLHARVMLEAAPPVPTLNGQPWKGALDLLPGRLHQDPARPGAILRRWFRGLRATG